MDSRASKRIVALLIAVGALAGCCARPRLGAEVSDVKRDERVVLFTTDASRSADGRSWRVPVHAWVYELEGTVARRAAIARALEARYGLAATSRRAEEHFDRVVELFVADSERCKTLFVEAAGGRFELPATAANGQVGFELTLDDAAVRGAARAGALDLRVVLPAGDERAFSGRANLVDVSGISVISDIDDTVKVSEVDDTKKLLERTFFRSFEAVPGMAALYRRWAARGASLHFVSSSPWQLYEPLDEFLDASGFPARSLSLKLVRVKDGTALDLFKEASETKPAQIEPILERFPGRRFVLVGDSGELDPEIYGNLMREHGDRIVHSYIRLVDGSPITEARFEKAFAKIDPARWTLFTDPAGLRLPGGGLGVEALGQ